MRKLFGKIFGSPNERELQRLRGMVDEINALADEYAAMSDEELRSLTPKFREELASGVELDDILPDAFAAVREVAWRTLQQRPYDVQVMGGIVLHEGKIAEMRTGEGKTLTATMPMYLNALEGRGAHLVTVNDYLAKRDTQWMGQIYHALGLTVGCIQHDGGLMFDPEYEPDDERQRFLRPVSRREAYACDITYGTNNEFGFDYLRDNMAPDLERTVQRGLYYCIVDEVDNILIDEARTPLIISGQADENVDRYYQFAQYVRQLRPERHYEVDLKRRSVTLTEEGIDRVEALLGIGEGESLYDDRYSEYTHYLEQALKAEALFKRDRDYIVRDGEVIIIDEFTGRQMIGRRFSEGLHQAIEAKENVRVQRETVTEATITFQNYFRLYEKLAGMTGTAETEAEELYTIYGLEVVVIPTHKPMIRQDLPDVVYRTEMGKFNAIVEEIQEKVAQGRPVLVGTTSIEKSELLSEMLRRKGIKHSVLNAKHHEREAEIVAQAGQAGAVTIATNMAGRGTDIKLGPGVAEAGGLHIIGTERHESRRIDNQLRGRAGRQGDPGSSQFFLSLEDDLMRRFASDRVASLMERLGINDDTPIEHSLISKSIENAQTKVEGHNFDIRKHVVEYDDVMNRQREVIYTRRRAILEGDDMRDRAIETIHNQIEMLVDVNWPDERSAEPQLDEMLAAYRGIVPTTKLGVSDLEALSRDEIIDLLCEDAEERYAEKEEAIGHDLMRRIERALMLNVMDRLWREHLTQMDDMRQGVGLQAYAQRDPLVTYKRQGFEMFEALLRNIEYDFAHQIFSVNVERRPIQRLAQPVMTNAPTEDGTRVPDGRKMRKVGRNDPCPCGSGKKYKHCHGRPSRVTAG
ncbi:MAG TPA: preprotein translocase subunit SecA [Thermomicrobiales bacterium]|nr:preprotein translocase subunit SecA [Thermomicrobiales bacterium]